MDTSARDLVEHAHALIGRGQLAQAAVVFEDVVRQFAEHKEAEIAVQVANALVSHGWTLEQLEQPEAAIAAYDEAVRRYGERPEASVVAQVAMGLVNKGLTLARLKQPTAVIVAAYDEVVQRYGDRREGIVVEQVACALGNRASSLERLAALEGRPVAAYDEIIERYRQRTEPAVVEQVLAALLAKGRLLGKKARLEAFYERFRYSEDGVLAPLDGAIAAYDAVLRSAGEGEERPVAAAAEQALLDKGCLLLDMAFRIQKLVPKQRWAVCAYAEQAASWTRDGIASLGELRRRYDARPDATLAERVAAALCFMGDHFAKVERVDDAVAAWDEAVRRFGDLEDVATARHVARALIGKGLALRFQAAPSDRRRALGSWEQVIRRYGERNEGWLRNAVAEATRYLKGDGLPVQPLVEEARDACAEVVRARGESPQDASLALEVAEAFSSKAGVLVRAANGIELEVDLNEQTTYPIRDHPEERALARSFIVEAIAAYDDIVERFGERREAAVAEQVVKAVNARRVLLERLNAR